MPKEGSDYGFQIFVQSLSRKFCSANKNVNENKKFRLFREIRSRLLQNSRNLFEIFVKFAKFIRNLFSQKNTIFLMQNEKISILSHENRTKISMQTLVVTIGF